MNSHRERVFLFSFSLRILVIEHDSFSVISCTQPSHGRSPRCSRSVCILLTFERDRDNVELGNHDYHPCKTLHTRVCVLWPGDLNHPRFTCHFHTGEQGRVYHGV